MKSPHASSIADGLFSKRVLHPWLDHRPESVPDIGSAYARLLRAPATGERLAYVHIPFCANHCLFCGFYREHTDEAVQRHYVDHLLDDLARDGERLAGRPGLIRAVFLGGGTPSALSAEDLSRLLNAIRAALPLAPDCEITVEGRVMGFTGDKLAAIAEAGANRVSIGIQSFDTALRRRLGRRADRAETIAFLESVRRTESLAVVGDLIYGLPGQTEAIWREDLATCVALGLDGIDLYCLNVHEGSPLAAAIATGTMPPPADLERARHFYAIGGEILDQAGWRRISQAHWAGSRRERNLYNQLTKDGADCLAFGAGAGGMLAGHRFLLEGNRETYQNRLAAGEKPIALMALPSPHTPARNAVMAAMEDGTLDLAHIEALVKPGFAARIAPMLEQWQGNGLLRRDGASLHLTATGRFWHNNLAQALFKAIALHCGDAGPAMVSAMAHPHAMRHPASSGHPHSHGARPHVA